MPIPLIFAGIAIATGAAGIGMGTKGGYDYHRASVLNKDSNRRLENASLRLETLREECGVALNSLGDEKITILSGSVNRFVNTFSMLKNVDFQGSEGLDEISKLSIDSKEFAEMKKLTAFSLTLLEGAGTGVLGGGLAAFGAYGAATIFGTASTGTAISTLSGIAAHNATLAFFGGGSLAAGGAGMAGGAVVLGGLVAGPALLVMGAIVGKKAGKSLEDARANAYMTNEICEELENGSVECIAIRRRCYMFYDLLARLDAILTPLTYAMEEIIDSEGIDYSKFCPQSKKSIASAAASVSAVKAVLDTPILNEDGSLTVDSERLLRDERYN